MDNCLTLLCSSAHSLSSRLSRSCIPTLLQALSLVSAWGQLEVNVALGAIFMLSLSVAGCPRQDQKAQGQQFCCAVGVRAFWAVPHDLYMFFVVCGGDKE